MFPFFTLIELYCFVIVSSPVVYIVIFFVRFDLLLLWKCSMSMVKCIRYANRIGGAKGSEMRLSIKQKTLKPSLRLFEVFVFVKSCKSTIIAIIFEKSRLNTFSNTVMRKVSIGDSFEKMIFWINLGSRF